MKKNFSKVHLQSLVGRGTSPLAKVWRPTGKSALSPHRVRALFASLPSSHGRPSKVKALSPSQESGHLLNWRDRSTNKSGLSPARVRALYRLPRGSAGGQECSLPVQGEVPLNAPSKGGSWTCKSAFTQASPSFVLEKVLQRVSNMSH